MISIRFESKALEPDTFQILQFDGEEEISHLFRFELHLVSRDPDIDFQAVLESGAVLEITTQDNTRYIHGMLSEFEQGGLWHSGLNEYRAVLVPRLWMLTQSQQNQIFQNQTVTDIIENELGEFSDKGRHPLVETGLGTDDYEIYTIRDYYEREYVVQYKETDFNFISRLMEHEGIFYFFEHNEEREKVVITDAMDADDDSEQCTAEFNKDAAAALYDRNVVYKLTRSQKQIPGSILMKDYNYRSPDLPMEAKGEVTTEGIEGIGFVTEFGAHFKEPEEGEELAAIRAEEFRCRQNIYSGESNIAGFYCGGLYSLGQHFREDYNQDYLLTRVEHHGKQDIESWGNVGGTTYYNQFSCIPSGLQYRPQRITPKPRMFGIMNGIIDSEQDMGRADLDEEGRYKVMMPFDISGVAPGKASRRIRMAQPYGGGGTGMSFPLIKGTEVIWSCIDGDIDRPIITGVVPNPLNPSVTTHENNTSNVIRTTSGITMGFHDGSGNGASQATTSEDGSLAAQQQNQIINPAAQSSGTAPTQITESPIFTDVSGLTNKSVQQPIILQQQMMGHELDLYGTDGFSSPDTGTGKQFSIGVPNYDSGAGAVGTWSNKDSYLRLGKAATWEVSAGGDFAEDGWFEYTDGKRTEITKGDVNRHHYGIVSDFYHTEQFGFSSDTQYAVFGGHTYDATLGMVGEFHAGGKSSSTIGIDVVFNSGISYEFGYAHKYSMTSGTEFTISDKIDQEASELVHLKVDPDNSGTPDKFMEKFSAGTAAVLATAATIPLAISVSREGSGTEDNSTLDNTVLKSVANTQYGISALMAAAATAHWIKKRKDKPASELKMEGNEVSLKVSGHKDTKREILLYTQETYNDNYPTRIELTRDKKKGSVSINAAGDDSGFIELVVGKSSITLEKDRIVFDSPFFEFKNNNAQEVVIKKGVWVTTGDLSVNKGSVSIKKTLNVSDTICGKELKSPSGGPIGGSPPPRPPRPIPAK